MLVYTVKELCRTCYTCVRECPAKAIKIVGGQAEVIESRCIVCGNCTKVCSRGAKKYLNTTDRVEKLLVGKGKIAAIIAPSFPAEFHDLGDLMKLPTLVRRLGFNYVGEVSFGADLVARKYKKLMDDSHGKNYISSDCPAIVNYVRFYHPALVDNLVPVVSPMVAMARVVRRLHGKDTKVVFIGPCIAKKSESREIDASITFPELRELLANAGIDHLNMEPSEFDAPLGGKGAVFPVARGLLQAAGIDDNAIGGTIIAAEGRTDFPEAIRDYEKGLLYEQHMELLCCKGCIMGPGMSKNGKVVNGRAEVSKYAAQKLANLDVELWERAVNDCSAIDLSARFNPDDQRMNQPVIDEVKRALAIMGKESEKDYLDCGACGYETCYEHAVAIVKGLAETEMCLPYTIEKLHNSVRDLALSNEKLTSVQQALKQSEKLAHMGQLSAGIAHELNNPLGVVIMYANILLEETAMEHPLRKDLQLIVDQAGRCRKIVGGLLNFARKNQVNYQSISVNELVTMSLESLIIPDGIEVVLSDKTKNPVAAFDLEQMTQVLTNLIKNSFEAMPGGGRIEIILEDTLGEVIVMVKDSGTGIRDEDKEKIFEPFFTTKGIGSGTGLGLATAYGIVKMHKGQITVESNADQETGPTGTIFKIVLPRKNQR